MHYCAGVCVNVLYINTTGTKLIIPWKLQDSASMPASRQYVVELLDV